MSDIFARVVEFTGDRPGKQVYTWCPGCDWMHPWTVEAPAGPNGDKLNSGITWTWDHNLVRPTFSPSLMIKTAVHLCKHTWTVCPSEEGGECDETSHRLGYKLLDGTAIAPKVYDPVPDGAVKVRVHSDPCQKNPWGPCHSFLKNGMWQFLNDSAHELAGKTVPMVPLKGTYAGNDEGG